jgi:hypothetical protein
MIWNAVCISNGRNLRGPNANRLTIQNKRNKTYKLKSRENFLDFIKYAINIVKMSNTACANVRRNGDLEINAMPDIRMAVALRACPKNQSIVYFRMSHRDRSILKKLSVSLWLLIIFATEAQRAQRRV